jgi:hypothetical protein
MNPYSKRSKKAPTLLPCLDVDEGKIRRMEVGMRMWEAPGCGGGEGSVQGSIPGGKFHKSEGLENLAPRPIWKRKKENH